MGMKKILVIDYDQNSLSFLQGALTKEGYLVVTAGDGQAGWDKYNKESPDLVLMEAMLPKVHGFELCQRITSERNSQAVVFIMTGVYKDRVYRTEALRTYGASEYFEKPLKMSELLASVQAVLGRPEARPAAEAGPVKPVKEGRPEPVLVDPRKIERPKTIEDKFALPADLAKLHRETPKIRVPAPASIEPSLETRLETIADELLKTAAVEPTRHRKTAEEVPLGNGDDNGNGHDSVDIDKFLKSALADFDLSHEKVKVPKTAPLKPPPAAEKPEPVPPPPAVFKPKPTPQPPQPVFERPKAQAAPPPPIVEKQAAEMPKPAPFTYPAEKPKAAPLAPPAAVFYKPTRPATTGTLTPGDPGSDASPFFTPDSTKSAQPSDVASVPHQARTVEQPRVQAPPAPAVFSAPAPKPLKAEEKVEKKPAPAPVSPAEPAKLETKARDIGAATLPNMFSEIAEVREKKGFSPLIAVGVSVAVVAVVGFFILRPKRPAVPVDDGLKSPQTIVQSNVPEKPVEEPPPPVTKPKPAAGKPRVETQTKVAEIGPSSEEAILIPATPASAPPALKSQASGDTTSGNVAESPAAKADPPPVKTEENPPQGTVSEAGTAGNPGTSAETPVAPPVKEGDLVDLGTVDEQPKTLKTPDPVYPPTALRLGVEGSITVNALIDERGNVVDTGILKGMMDDKGLGKAAETAVRKWKFQPAQKGGVNVKVWKAFVIVFKTQKISAETID